MNTLGNIVWLIFGGLIAGVMYILYGLLLCITIIGIPFGVKIMRLGVFAFWPFGRKIFMNPAAGCLTIGFNILWVISGWWEIALVHFLFGVLLCITIIGIPFGKQHFKIAAYTLAPFGCEIS